MNSPQASDPGPVEKPPLGQPLYDSPFLLLVVGFVIMALVYTLWGFWEILTLPLATLP